MTEEQVIEPYGEPDSRLPWEFIPNMEEKCLEFFKVPDKEVEEAPEEKAELEEMYPINGE